MGQPPGSGGALATLGLREADPKSYFLTRSYSLFTTYLLLITPIVGPTLREADRPDTRGAYQPGSAMPHVAAARAPKQDMLVGDVNFDGESPLGLLLVQTPRRAPDDSAVILVTPL